MMTKSPYFDVCSYKVVSERTHARATRVQAMVEVRIGNNCVRRSAMGIGPVHALDLALRECLESSFPELEGVRLSDYQVSVVDAGQGTGAQVRVLIQAFDGDRRWDAGCVGGNVVDASFEALCSTLVMGIMHGRSQKQRSA